MSTENLTKGGRLLESANCVLRLTFNKRRVEVIYKGEVKDTLPIFDNPDTGSKELQVESLAGTVSFMNIDYLYEL